MRNKRAGLRKKVRFFLVFSLFLPAVWANGEEAIRQWQHGGAYELALAELERIQPSSSADYPQWERLERQRFSLYSSLEQWNEILTRHNALPANAEGQFRQWAEIQAVHAYLALRKTEVALELAQRRLWAEGDMHSLQLWRVMLIQIYAATQDDEAVDIAWRRFRQDALQNEAQGSGPSSSLLAQESANALRAHARSLMRRERYAEAVSELLEERSIDGRLLYAAGQLLVNTGSVDEVYALTRQLAETDGASALQRRRALILLARAAGRKKQYAQRVDALVGALSIPVHRSEQDSLFTLNADDLWAAYEEWGHSLGVAAGLDANYENQWVAALQTSQPAGQQVALASVLVLGGRSARARDEAGKTLLEALPRVSRGAEQALWLFNESERLQRSFVDLPDDLQRAAMRAALRIADLVRVGELRQRRGPVADPLADQANGVLDVHARLLLGEPAAATRFLNEGLDNLSAWFRSSQQDLLVLLRDMQAAGYHAPVALAGGKLARVSGDQDIRQQGAEYAARSLLATDQPLPAAKLALSQLAEMPDAESSDLALLAYEALWRSGLREDAAQLRHRMLSSPELQEPAADLRRRVQLPVSR